MHYAITVLIKLLADLTKDVTLKGLNAVPKTDENFHILFTLKTPSLFTKALSGNLRDVQIKKNTAWKQHLFFFCFLCANELEFECKGDFYYLSYFIILGA